MAYDGLYLNFGKSTAPRIVVLFEKVAHRRRLGGGGMGGAGRGGSRVALRAKTRRGGGDT